MKLSLHELPTTIYANSLNAPNSAATPNKPPILPKLSTNYDSIMQNKANFPDNQMNVSAITTKDYENKTLSGSGKNKANSKPNKANLLNAQMNVSSIITKDYENKPRLRAKAKQTQNKPNTNPIKPNFTSAQKPATAVRLQTSAFGPRPSVNERDEKNRSRRPLIDPRCPWRQSDCIKQAPVLGERSDINGHFVACWRY